MDFDLRQFRIPLSETTQTHLLKVYTELATMFLISTFGVYLDMQYYLQGTLSFIVMFGSLIAFAFTDEIRNQTQARSLLYVFALAKGISLGGLINLVTYVDESLVFTALGATGAIFASFTLSVLYSRNRTTFISAGLISSLLSTMFWMRIANLFFNSSSLYDIELYTGLALFSAYVVYDTQVMINKAERGEKTVLRHAMELYSDFVALFVRILIVLLKKGEKDKKKRR